MDGYESLWPRLHAWHVGLMTMEGGGAGALGAVDAQPSRARRGPSMPTPRAVGPVQLLHSVWGIGSGECHPVHPSLGNLEALGRSDRFKVIQRVRDMHTGLGVTRFECCNMR